MSPTERTLRWLRDAGWRADVVERWLPHARVRKDVYGFIDILCINDDDTLGVQATSAANVGSRIQKIRALDAARSWLVGGRKLWVVGWRKYRKAEAGKHWRPLVRELTLSDLDVEVGDEESGQVRVDSRH